MGGDRRGPFPLTLRLAHEFCICAVPVHVHRTVHTNEYFAYYATPTEDVDGRFDQIFAFRSSRHAPPPRRGGRACRAHADARARA